MSCSMKNVQVGSIGVADLSDVPCDSCGKDLQVSVKTVYLGHLVSRGVFGHVHQLIPCYICTRCGSRILRAVELCNDHGDSLCDSLFNLSTIAS